MVTLESCLGAVFEDSLGRMLDVLCRNRYQDVSKVLLRVRLRLGWSSLCGNTGKLSGRCV